MKILGIETSCDETSLAIVVDGTKVLSNVIATSIDMHIKTGGIVPENAARQQIKSIIPVLIESLKESNIKIEKVDAIAVTIGPGLIGSLLVGIETARTLGIIYNKPLIPVNHLVGHIYANFIKETEDSELPEFPILSLVVSGGHTDLVLIKNHGDVTWIGGTKDDASGEAFDKTARILGLPYPGGPSISKAAEEYSKNNPDLKYNFFPRPMIQDKNYWWSFSGLKTAVMNEVMKNKTIDSNKVNEYAAEVQEAIVDVLVNKTLRAIDEFKPKSFALAGGVAANKRLRDKFEIKLINKVPFFVPPFKLCTDNAAYIASCAFFNNKAVNFKDIYPIPDLTITGEIK